MQNATLTKVTRNGQTTLPAAARRALHIEEGDYIEVRVSQDSLILTPKKLVDKSQTYFWSPEWQAAEQEASEDIASGRVREFANADDLVTSLNKARGRKR